MVRGSAKCLDVKWSTSDLARAAASAVRLPGLASAAIMLRYCAFIKSQRRGSVLVAGAGHEIGMQPGVAVDPNHLRGQVRNVVRLEIGERRVAEVVRIAFRRDMITGLPQTMNSGSLFGNAKSRKTSRRIGQNADVALLSHAGISQDGTWPISLT